MRRVIASLILLLSATFAAAQVPFPQTLPPNTVYGRLGISAGPGQAIPFSVLGSQITPYVYFSTFSPALDCVTDDSAKLQSAINSLTEGGILYMPDRQFCAAIATPITITKPIFIVGPGAGSYHTAGSPLNTSVCQFKWTGSAGGTMLTWAPVAGAGNQRISSGGMIGCGLNGNSSGGVGIQANSMYNPYFDVFLYSWTTAAFRTSTVSPLGESADIQHGYFKITFNQGSSTDGVGVEVDGTAGGASGNTSVNTFLIDGFHMNGTGVNIKNADSNYFRSIHLARTPGGTAIGVACRASSVAGTQCRANRFGWLSPHTGGFKVEGTDTAANIPYGIYVEAYDKQNGAPDPTLGTGAQLAWIDNLRAFYRQVAADGSPAVVFGGTTKGIRFDFNASQSTIRGVDTAGTGAQQALGIDGSGLFFNISGAVTPNAMQIANSTGVSIGTNTDAGSTNLLVAGTATANAVAVSGSTVPTIGINAATANTLNVYTRGLVSAQFLSDASAANFPQFTAKAAGNPVILGAAGSDTNIGYIVATKGTGGIDLRTDITGAFPVQFSITHTASATRSIQVTGSNGGNPTITTSAGNLAVTPPLVGASYLQTGLTVVNSLPACAAGTKGARFFVTDNATALAFAAVITTGGAIQTPVYCDGTTWRQG